MKKYYFILFIFFISKSYSQLAPGCSSASAFCAGTSSAGLPFPNTTNLPNDNDYSCLGSQPNASWYYLQISQAGNLTFTISQTSTAGAPIDVDFIAWGPFLSAPMCGTTNLNATSEVGCSYSASATETFTINNALAGQYYMILMTNFRNLSGTITLAQTGGAGATSCDIVCPLTVSGGGVSDCRDNILTANYLNSSPTLSTFQWSFNGVNIPGPAGTTSSLHTLAYGDGSYCVKALSPGCSSTQTPYCVTISNGDPVPFNPPNDLFACTNSTFNLTQNTNTLIVGLPPPASRYKVRYNTNATNALTNAAPISTALQTVYPGTSGDTIYATVMDLSGTYCYAVAQFTLRTQPCGFTTTNTGPKCVGSTFNLSATDPNATDPTIGPVTYAWTGPNGWTASGQNVNGVPTPSLSGNYSYICTATPTTVGGAPLTSTTIVVVNAIPVATATPVSNSICSGITTDIPLGSNVAGTTFAWDAVPTNALGSSSSAGSNIAETLTATGSLVGNVDYTITPTANSCVGLPIHAIINVNPIPIAIATPTPATICSGLTSNIILTSTPPGSTFIWTAVPTDVSGATPGSGTTIAQVLTAQGNFAGQVDYKITPTLNTCPGLEIVSVISVNPSAQVNQPATQVVCNGSATTAVTFTTNNTVGTTTYNWTNSDSTIGLAISGTGDIPIFNTINNGVIPVVASITVTPTFTNAGVSCLGYPKVFTVTVNPIPVAITPLPSTICSSNNTNIILASSGTGVVYNWTASGTDVTGFVDGSSTNNPIVQNLTTTSMNPGTAVYIITPSIGSCVGIPVTTKVTINPLPTVVMTGTTTICFNGTASVDFIGTPNAIVTYTINRGTNLTVTLDASGAFSLSTGNLTTDTRYDLVNVVSSGMPQCTQIQSGAVLITVVPIPLVIIRVGASTVCSGSTTQISLDSNVTGANLNWTIFNQSGISGANLGNGALISDVLTTTGNVTGNVTYEITANSGSCFGPSSKVTINVNPIPDVIASTNLQTFCSGGSTNVSLSSSIAGTTYSWNVISSLVSGASGGSGSSINQPLFATGNSTGVVDYLISPLSNGCSGTPINVSVQVNPYPTAFANVALSTICSGTTTNIALSSNVAGTTFDWFSTQTSSPAQITGNSNGSLSLISDLLTTIGYIQGEVTYSITPTYSTCIGSPISVLIKVNPRPVVFPSTTSAIVCSGDAPNFILSSGGFSNTTFSWTVSQTAVTGALAGSGTIIDNILHAGTFAGTAVYTVTPSSNSCLGSTVVITVNVNPLPLPQTIDGNICVNLATNEVSPYTLETHLSDNLYDFAWTYNGQSVFGVNSTLIASLAGIYSVVATNVNTNCKSLPTPAVVTESNPGMSFTTTQTLAFSNNATITVDSVTGGVNVVYQYSLDFGPFQLDNFFENVTPGPHTITVADDNGCTNLSKTIYVIGYPTYFTPNGDGINDTWNIIGLDASAKIFIFDRNGKLIKQISPTSEGWDGTLNGQQLSATDFWFTVDYTEDLPTVGTSKTFKSHFSLKR